jgi:hypothetical protein
MDRPRSRGRLALSLGVVAFVALPFSYSWLLSPGEDPPWLWPVDAIAEWGGLGAAGASIWLTRQTRSPVAVRARRIAIAALAVYVVAFTALAVLYRS